MGGDSQTGRQKAESLGGNERISELMEVLSHQRRRYAVYCLHHSETPMAVADITDEIVRREMDTDPTNVPEVREQIYADLYHTHLPKLAAADILTFNSDEPLVTLGSKTHELQPYLEQLCDEDWPPANKPQTSTD